MNDTLKEGGRGNSEGISRNRLRSLLVISEFALALMLLIGAGLMIRTFAALQAVDAGFNPHNVISMIVSVAGSKEADPARRAIFYRQLIERVRSIPGVQAAGGSIICLSSEICGDGRSSSKAARSRVPENRPAPFIAW